MESLSDSLILLVISLYLTRKPKAITVIERSLANDLTCCHTKNAWGRFTGFG